MSNQTFLIWNEKSNSLIQLKCPESIKRRIKALAKSEGKTVTSYMLEKSLNELSQEMKLNKIIELLEKEKNENNKGR